MSNLLEAVVAVALVAVLATIVAGGAQMPARRPHGTALLIEAALAEARALAAASGNDADAAYPSGATVVVQPDPARTGDSIVAVYRSRPIARGGPAFAPPPDAGFPPQTAPGLVRFESVAGDAIEEPFAIMISGAGFASIAQLRAPYDPVTPALFSRDPGCSEGSLVVEIGELREAHPIGCSGATYVAN